MTTTDFLITDTASGQQLAVSDIHAALADHDGYVLPPVAVDPDLPLPVAEHMDRRAHQRWGMGVDAWLAETRDWIAEQARRTDLPPPAQPEPAVQWAQLPDDPPLKDNPYKDLSPEVRDAEHAAWVERAQAQAQLATRVQQATERQARHDDDWRGQGQVPVQQHPDQPVHRKPRLLAWADRFIAWHKQRQEQEATP